MRVRLFGGKWTKIGALFALALAAWWSAPAIAGLSEAIVDHSRGHLEIKHYGEPMIGMETYYRLMRDRYGVNVDEAGCVVTDALIRYITAYNWYSQRRLLARFGHDVAGECARDAAREVQRTPQPRATP